MERRGIHNPGCLCYLISVVQLLFSCIEFRDNLRKVTQDLQYSQSVVHVLDSLFRMMECDVITISAEEYIDIEPLHILLYSSDIFLQQDASDCLSILFQQISKEITDSSLVASMTGELINRIYVGQNEHLVNERFEKFFFVSIGIGTTVLDFPRDTLEQSLEDFTRSEQIRYGREMSGDNNIPELTMRQTWFSHLPNRLLFHLKRFRYDRDKKRKVKLHDRFEFPEVLDMRPYVISSMVMASYAYRLTGCVVHEGASAYGGHYYYVSRDNDHPSNWYKLDDECVTRFDFDTHKEVELFGGNDDDDELFADSESDDDDSSDNSSHSSSIESVNADFDMLENEIIDVEDNITDDNSVLLVDEEPHTPRSRSTSNSSACLPRSACILVYDKIPLI